MRKLFWQIIAGILGIFLATKFIPGVSLNVIPGKSIYFGIEFTQDWQILIFIGIVLGLINFFIKPILNLITFPLRILTFGLFSLILNMAIVFFLDIIFPELKIVGFFSLLLTTLIISLLSIILNLK
jgi:putative membrane protein